MGDLDLHLQGHLSVRPRGYAPLLSTFQSAEILRNLLSWKIYNTKCTKTLHMTSPYQMASPVHDWIC